MLICSKWQSFDGWGWGNYAYKTRLKGLKCISKVIRSKIQFYKTKTKTLLPFFFNYFRKHTN